MAKTARRSVASDPSSPHSKTHFRTPFIVDATSPVGHHQNQLPPPAHHPYTTQAAPPLSKSHVNSENASTEYGSHHEASHNTSSAPSSRPAPPLPAFNGTRIVDRVAYERERVRVEFYATYDVMTGVRIAATLGGFFGLMVFLVVYKSRGESQETIKALKDPKIAAVAAAVMQEEEDRELQEAMHATGMSIYPDEYDHIGYRRGRLMSVGNISAPPVFNRGYRFSSIGGGYSSLLRPSSSSRRYSCSESGQKNDSSRSASARVLSAYPMGGSFGIDDYFLETDGDEADDEYDQVTTNSMDVERPDSFLSVPDKGQVSRRSSNITCCSTESSFLERRCSAMTLGLTSIQPIRPRTPSRRQSTTESWDYYYPGIQVIEATPKTSPCPSERSASDCHKAPPPMPTNQQSSTKKAASNTQPSAALKYRAKSLSIEEQQRQDSIDTISVYSSDDKLPTTTATSHDTISGRRRKNTTGSAEELSQVTRNSSHQQLISQSSRSQPNIIRRAPLASLSSFKISSVDYQDSDLKSLGSDSVFAESYADTDDEMDQFSLDSDETGTSDAQSPPNTRSPSQQQQHVAAADALRRHSMMASRLSVASKGSSSCTSRPSVATIGLATICTSVNERESKTYGRGRRILQRSSTIYPSSESLSKTPSNHPISQPPLAVSPKTFHTFETQATIERTSPSAMSTASSSTPSSASVIHQHLYSTPPSTRKSEPPMPPPRTVRPKSISTRPASYSGSSSVKAHKLSNVFSCSQRSNNSQLDAPKAHRIPLEHQSSRTQPLTSDDLTTVNVVNRLNPNTSVIIELPVLSAGPSTIATAADAEAGVSGDPPIDPSLPPGTKRKWSKETLF